MKRRTFSQRHYLAVIHGDFKVLMRYARRGEPTAPQAPSLVGMSQSQRKRKARELAFFWVKRSIQQAYAAQAEALRARKRGEDVVNPWDWHYEDHPGAYQNARMCYRIGERLRPCPGCLECEPKDCDGCGFSLGSGEDCEVCDAHAVDRYVMGCDGSGVLPAKRRAGGGR